MQDPPSTSPSLGAHPAASAANGELEAARRGIGQLQQHYEQLRQLLETVLAIDGELLWEWEEDGDTLLFHRPEQGHEGESSERLQALLDDAHVDDQPALRAAWWRLRRRESRGFEHTFRRAVAMEWRWVRMRGRVASAPGEEPLRVIGTLADVSTAQHEEALLALRAQAFARSDEAMLLLDERGGILGANAAAQRLLGTAEGPLEGTRITALLREVELGLVAASRQGEWRGDAALHRRRDGERWLQVRVHACGDESDGQRTMLLTARDITDERRAAENLRRLAHFDALTGLPNRTSLQEELRQRLDRAESPGLALLFINLDSFKQINDALGHDYGDSLLIEVGRRLRLLAGAPAFVARWGSDEFIVLLGQRNPKAEARKVAETVLGQLRQETEVGGYRLSAGASIGIALAPEHSRTADMLIRHADTAMQAAKKSHRGGWEMFRQELDDDGLRRLTLIHLLRQDADRGRFGFVAQPKVNGQGLAVGFELLIRWKTTDFGSVPPAQFIPLAEEIGVISHLGREAMLAAGRLIRNLQDSGCPLPVAVNLSPRQLADPALEQALLESCEIEGVSPRLLEIEVTESALVDNLDRAKARLSALRERGFRTALDDFGTGFSSLSYLRDLPFDKVKIDKSFVTALRDGPRAIALLHGIGNLCRALGMESVAEGVETLGEFETLQAIGIDEYQGYHFSRPLPFDKAIAFARRHR